TLALAAGRALAAGWSLRVEGAVQQFPRTADGRAQVRTGCRSGGAGIPARGNEDPAATGHRQLPGRLRCVSEPAASDVGVSASRMPVSLVLGSGGARGYAHIGVIEELVAHGFDIRAIAGSSMGELIGGMHAAGKLDSYRDWVLPLARMAILRVSDVTFRGGGFMKDYRVIHAMHQMVGNVLIEDEPIAYTAVAVDFDAKREVWFSR